MKAGLKDKSGATCTLYRDIVWTPLRVLGAVVLLLVVLSSAGGCSWLGDKFRGDGVKREEFDDLSGRVVKLEDTVFGPAVAQGSSSAPGSGLSKGLVPPASFPPGGQPVDPAFAAAFAPYGAVQTPARTSGADRTQYNRGQSLLKQKKYAQAAVVFSEMLRDNPGGSLAPNARYWLGECRYAAGDFSGALAEFQRGLADYPQSNKAPDYLLKMSYCQSRLGYGPEAMRSLNQLLAAYPDSPSAQLVKSGRTRFVGN